MTNAISLPRSSNFVLIKKKNDKKYTRYMQKHLEYKNA